MAEINQYQLNRLYELLDKRDWRIVAMLTEEAGEVQGAFNKWQSGHRKKPKTKQDVIEELIQLTACCYLAALHFAISPYLLNQRVNMFLDDKADELGSAID